MSVNPADQPRHGHQAGDLLAGRFRIVRFAGAGGMGEVYEAADEELGGTVALKTIRADRLERSAAALDRFRDEAKLARRVTHPNVCRVFDVGHDGDRVFITMEFIRGETLANLLKGSGCVPVDAALSLARQMAAGLDALHEQGIVHRDFKTSNVIIADAPSGTQRAVITDFGLARPREETMTIDAQGVPHIMGTPDYMAPEQLTGKPVTTATDVYALGLVLYEMTAGRRPYTGGSAVENAMQRLGERPAPPSRHNAGIPRHWDQVVLRCLERDPDARPASAGEVIAALSCETRLPIRRRVWLLAASAVILAAALGLGVWGVVGRGGSPAITTTKGAHATYLQAQDALDHYYRPHGVEDALRLFDETVRQDPGFALAYAGLARANFQQYWQMRDSKYIQPARENAEKALALDSKLASVHVTLGRLYTETGQNDLATQELNEALRLDARNAETYYALAMLFDKQGRTVEVEPTYQKAIDMAPSDWRFPDNLADYYLRTGKLNKALELSLQAVSLTPDNPRALNNLGRVYYRLGRLAEARTAYENANLIEPGYSRYANLGVILDDEGKPLEAASAYRKALELNAGSYVVWGNLGSALASAGREAEARKAYSRAIALAEDLRAKRPNDAELVSQLGRYYASVGSAEKSIPLLRQAVTLTPDDPQILFRQAIAYELLHRRSDALTCVDLALSHGLIFARVEREPLMASLRQDPRFLKLAAQHKN